MFGQVNPRSISFDQISKFRDAIREAHGVRAAHRTIKIWRALSKINALNKLCDLERDPSNGFQNHAAEGRNVYWLEAQARALGNKAWSLGYCGFAAVIAIMWDTQLSPVDVRSLKASQFATAGQREIFFTSRAKTAKPVGGMLQARSMVRPADYLEKLGRGHATRRVHFPEPVWRPLQQGHPGRRLPRRAACPLRR